MGYRLIMAAWSLALIVVIPHIAWAELSQEAVDAMQRGAQLYEAEEYEAAVREFQAAYEISKEATDGPYAIFIFNAARASQVGGDERQARHLFEEALDLEGPNALPARERARAQGYVGAIETQLRAKQAANQIDIERQDKPEEVAFVPRHDLETTESLDEPRWALGKRLGWGGAATGGVLLLSAGALAISSSRQINQIWEMDNRSAYESQRAVIERNQMLGRGMLWTGGLFVLGGTALALWSGSGTINERSNQVGFWGGGDSLHVFWEVRFD